MEKEIVERLLILTVVLVAVSPAFVEGETIHIEAEDCNLDSWNLDPPSATVSVVTTADGHVGVEIVGGAMQATGIGQLRLPGTIPNDEYIITLYYLTGRVSSGSTFAVQFGADSGTVTKYGAESIDWHLFYPNSSTATRYTWYDVELTPDGCPFATSSQSPLPVAVGIQDVNEGDFYINLWDQCFPSGENAIIDYIELKPVQFETADLTDDGYVDFNDLRIVFLNWLGDWPPADASPAGGGDGIIDFPDYATIAKDWWKAAPHIADINAQAYTAECNEAWIAEFIVSIDDKRDEAIGDVEVTAQWAGIHGGLGTTVETTDANGQAVFTSNCMPFTGTTSLTVTDVFRSGPAYDANENVEVSDSVYCDVNSTWIPIVQAEDWIISSENGHYAEGNAPPEWAATGQVVWVGTDSAGNPEHAAGRIIVALPPEPNLSGDVKFTFPGAIPGGDYRLTIKWHSGTMNGTPWAFKLGADGGSVTEHGVSTSGKWHYFYPGHQGSHSDQWFTHDLAGPNPVQFSMWPNSPVGDYVTFSGIDQGEFYIRIWDLSPAKDNYFAIDYFELTPLY